MDKELYVWPPELTEQMLQLRHEHDAIFRSCKKPWREFHKILQKHKFPKDITVNRVRKKWSYLYDTYKIVKKENNEGWPYYKQFEKIFAASNVLDKYEMWSDEWRLKLVMCITEAKQLKLDFFNTWITVEHALRLQDLPLDCSIQDIKGLWHHIKVVFRRKHRIASKRGAEAAAWPLYDAMLKYYESFEPDCLTSIENDTTSTAVTHKSNGKSRSKQIVDDNNEGGEIQWSKHITESFIQLRFQHDWLFTQNKRAWSKFVQIMIEEYGFPKTLTSRDVSKKWASTFSEYQKAKATNNTSWQYYNMFELYLGEGSLSLNPLLGWEEEWISNLISIRTDLDRYFNGTTEKVINIGWREVEKRLRTIGLPLDHSVLQLQAIWNHLVKTFRWKKKFADKGLLTENWPYFEAMTHYEEVKEKLAINTLDVNHKMEPEVDSYDDDYEDDIKLFDLKQRLETRVKPKLEKLECWEENQCRSCSGEDGCVNIYERRDDEGLNLADKLKIVGGIEVDINDNLPSQICLKCVKELDNAYKFRRKCQEVDKDYRNRPIVVCNIKLEENEDATGNVEQNENYERDEVNRTDFDSDHCNDDDYVPVVKKKKKVLVKKITKKPSVIQRKRQKKSRYVYTKVCEICGKNTQNLLSHLDMHSNAKMYSCDVCGKKFKFKSGLNIHKAVHNPTPRKTCEVCGKTFHILAQYRRHFVYHANERKFECETCGKRFNSADILRVHVRIHTDERPFSCPDCGKTFRTAGCVGRHRRIVHRVVRAQRPNNTNQTVVQ